MNIIRLEKDKEKSLAIKFKADTLSATNLVPGVYKTQDEMSTIENDCHFMSLPEVKLQIETNFGFSKNNVKGKYGTAKLFAFSFHKKVIICVVELGDVGAKWYWMDSVEDGSRYEKPTLLPFDKSVVDFWPSFCTTFKEFLLTKSD